MSYQVLARKWRPKTFGQLVGQDHVVRALSNALTQQRLHHAYLFTGTRGVGKTTLARILAKALNCETGITAMPCGTCGACTEIDQGRFVDLLEVDAATNTKVEEMRELLDQAQYMPVSGRFKVYIIDEVHMLSRSAFNSMLKTLEEPPEHVKFILATTDPQKVPVTVVSRCLQFNLKQMPTNTIAGHLAHVLQQENIEFETSALNALARAAHGSMRDSLSLLDQAIAYGGGRVDREQVSAMLGAVDHDYLFNILNALAKQDGPLMIAEADRMQERALSFEEGLQELGVILHQIALRQTVPEALRESTPGFEQIAALAELFTPDDVQLNYQISVNGRRDLGLAPDEYAGFTMTLMRMLAFAITDSGVHTRIQPAQPVAARLVEAFHTDAPRAAPRAASSQMPASDRAATALQANGTAKFDGDWPALVAKLQTNRMAHMLASHAELKRYTDNHIHLAVAEEHKNLLDKAFQDKLKIAVEQLLGAGIRLSISVGDAASSLAAITNRSEREQQANAIASIERDP
ncbi:MAG: DNA polymerase III subunit gamma/tau, partial [Pseudomonadota bacterium]|nr:DNA polymerase III subunit gamma/tau [Pseudomonadota bacterium]